MPNPQLGGQFAPKATFGGGNEAQAAATQAQSVTTEGNIERECTFKPFINRSVPDFGRMHAQLARQLAANKETRKFQQVTIGQCAITDHDACVITFAIDNEGTNAVLVHPTSTCRGEAATTDACRYRSYGT